MPQQKTQPPKPPDLLQENLLLKTLLQGTDQAIFAFGKNGICLPAATPACERILGHAPAGRAIAEALGVTKDQLAIFKGWCELLFEELVDFADLVKVGPQRLSALMGRHVTLEYSPVRAADGHLEAVLVVATDRTAEDLSRTQAKRLEAFANLILTVSQDRERFASFVESTRKIFAETRSLLERPLLDEKSWMEVKRRMHALKNAAVVFGVDMIRDAIEQLEAKLSAENDLRLIATHTKQTVSAIENSFEDLFGEYREIFNELTMQGRPSRVVALDTLEAMGAQIKSIGSPAARRLYYDFIDEVIAVPIRNVFAEFDPLLHAQAMRLSKQVAPIKCIGDELAVMPEGLETLRTIMGHIFSNVVDHGIESGETRRARGKTPMGEIVVEFRQLEDELGPHLRLIVNDDGNGIDTDALRSLLGSTMPNTAGLSEQEVADHIFDAGLTTTKKFRGFSGHGIGLHTVKTEVERLGGSIRVHSEAGKGAAFVIELPLDESGHAPRLKARTSAA